MTSRESSDRSGYVQNVKIFDVEKRYKSGPKHYVFVMQVTWASPTNVFIIYRRYAQFYDLQCKLLDLFVDTPSPENESRQRRQIPFLPGKIILGRSQIRQIAVERQKLLNDYCQAIIALPERISRSRTILDFFRPNEEDVQKPKEGIKNDKKVPSISSLVISEPKKLADYRCLNDFTASDKLEMTLTKDTLVQVLQKHENGWWFVQHNDQRGFVPGAYLVAAEQTPVDRQSDNTPASHNEVHVVSKTYQGKAADEISLEQGSFVIVIEKSLTGWWTVKFHGKIGQFPSIYLSSCHGRHTPDIVTNSSSSSVFETPTYESIPQSNDSDWDEDEDDDHSGTKNGTKPEIWYAHSDFLDDAGDCLSFKRGDRIEIHGQYPNGWWSGRGVSDGPVLTWIPANYLQRTPISDRPVTPVSDNVSDSEIDSHTTQIVPDPSPEKEPKNEPKQEALEENIYESFEEVAPVPVAVVAAAPPPPPPPPSSVRSPSPALTSTPEVSKTLAPVIPKIVTKKPPVATPISSNIKEEDGKPKSVRDLVKRFNRN